MKDLSGKNFGLLIAYVVPGAIVLIGLGAFSPTIQTWLINPSPAEPSVGGFLFVTLASVAAGMTASAVRWATIDRLHRWTGVVKSAWDDSKLPERLDAFEAIVEAHYRYYQFHSNSLIAMLFSYVAWRPSLVVDIVLCVPTVNTKNIKSPRTLSRVKGNFFSAGRSGADPWRSNRSSQRLSTGGCDCGNAWSGLSRIALRLEAYYAASCSPSSSVPLWFEDFSNSAMTSSRRRL